MLGRLLPAVIYVDISYCSANVSGVVYLDMVNVRRRNWVMAEKELLLLSRWMIKINEVSVLI